MSEHEGVTRQIGGESGHRGLLGLGGARTMWRVLAIAAPVAFAIIGMPFIGLPALIIGMGLAGLVFLLTIPTERGSVFHRWRKRRRWRSRVRLGTDVFVPYSPETWEAAQLAIANARGRRERKSARQYLNAVRAMPDGADGMGWLQSDRGRPGIAWQAPLGEEDRLTVTFALPGQLRGMQTAEKVGANAEAFGRFTARRARAGLMRQVQPLARLLPVDTALYEQWISTRVDQDRTPERAVRSYDEVVRATGQAAMTPRHYVTCTWPITSEFEQRAARYGDDVDGWRALMAQEIADAVRDLEAVGFNGARPLSARALAALILHMQNPSRPADLVADVDPARFGLPSRDQWSAHVVSGFDPETGEPVIWWHRTARIESDAMSASPRTPLWHLPLMQGTESDVVRSVAFNLELVPAEVMRARTRQDVTNDLATKVGKQKRGEVEDGTEDVQLNAAQQRQLDLRPAQHQHGVYWVGYVTVSARSRGELAEACRGIEVLCSNELGVERLVWEDTYQSVASGNTWPLGRGLIPTPTSVTESVMRGLRGRVEKEALT